MKLLIDFIDRIGIMNFVLIITMLIILLAVRGIYLIIQRGNKDADTIREHYEEASDSITEQNKKEWQYIAQIARLEQALEDCQKNLERGAITQQEADVMREMIIKQREEIRQKQGIIEHQSQQLKENHR